MRGGRGLVDLGLRHGKRVRGLKIAVTLEVPGGVCGLCGRSHGNRLSLRIGSCGGVNLCLRLLEFSFRGGLLSDDLLQPGTHVTGVDLDQDLPGAHEIVVIDVDAHHPTGDLGCQPHDTRIYKCIVGALEAPLVTPEHHAHDEQDDYTEDERNSHQGSAKKIAASLPLLLGCLLVWLASFALGLPIRRFVFFGQESSACCVHSHACDRNAAAHEPVP